MGINNIGDDASGAKTLNRVRLREDEPMRIFQTVMDNLDTFLSVERVHADLSPINVLYWNSKIRIIDFPQSVNPYINENAFSFLLRDVENICHYFRKYEIDCDSYELATSFWNKYLF